MHSYAELKLTIDGAQRVEVLFRRCSRTSPVNGTHRQKQGRGINPFTILMYTVIGSHGSFLEKLVDRLHSYSVQT